MADAVSKSGGDDDAPMEQSHIESVANDALFFEVNEKLASDFQGQLQSLVSALRTSSLLETNLGHLVHRLAADPDVLS